MLHVPVLVEGSAPAESLATPSRGHSSLSLRRVHFQPWQGWEGAFPLLRGGFTKLLTQLSPLSSHPSLTPVPRLLGDSVPWFPESSSSALRLLSRQSLLLFSCSLCPAYDPGDCSQASCHHYSPFFPTFRSYRCSLLFHFSYCVDF